MISLPEKFKENMRNLLDEDCYEKFLSSFNDEAKRGVVINTKIASSDLTCRFLPKLIKIPFAKSGYAIKSKEKLGNTWIHHAGLIYMQEPSSMAAGNLVENKENLKILDLCASPGGKTINAYLACGKNSVIVSNEINKERAKILFQNIERLGLNNCIVTSNSPKELADNFNEYFDYILVDAPCSGEGMFRKDPPTICEWQENTPEMNSLRQKEILFYADKMLKNGGKLIYSTCTYSQKEDEDIVEMMLGNGYQLLKPNEDVLNNSRRGITDNTHFACRFYPFDNIGEGQFVCLLQKENDANSNIEVSNFAENNAKLDTKQGKNAKKIAKSENKNIKNAENIAKTFIKDTISGENLDIIIDYNKVYAEIDEDISCRNLKFISKGINVGEVVKDRLEPHHQFFKVFGKNFKIKIELKKEDAEKYLAGEELETSLKEKGFAVVLFSGVVLGGVKMANGRLKNYYPKALRSKLKI